MIRAIAETGNMTRAADLLFLSQSALSQQLKDIEGKLKADLFFRTRKKMVLTPTGRHLLQTAGHIIDTLEEAELEIARRVAGERGELKVGTRCVYCYKWLPGVMTVFQEKFPNIEFELGNSEDPARELQEKKYDLIINAATASPPDETFSHTPLFRDDFVCILPAEHPIGTQSFIRLQDFSRMRLISHAEKTRNPFYKTMLKPQGIEPERYMAVSQPQAIVEMVSSGFGVSIFPRWAIKSLLSTSQIISRPITKNGLQLTWYISSLQKMTKSLFHKEFIHIINTLTPTDSA